MQQITTVHTSAPSCTPCRLLAAGIVAGPVFYAGVIAQMLTRAGFHIVRHPLSLLSLGKFGWIQAINFIATGLLACAGAVGLQQSMAKGPGATLLTGRLEIINAPWSVASAWLKRAPGKVHQSGQISKSPYAPSSHRVQSLRLIWPLS